ncbi:helix-turn-helix domain-containing protein [Microvirga yunnanensis]|uniref:helix-turn-helix domain-containing protein n=1 Tax=Microvirga yunnanensis TaxID=2953740 RepID=UPI0021C8516B|nr:helix-turn-helix domain-containing protein [Microvirga sp. HBU65207]
MALARVELADAAGTSTVQFDRILQDLQADGLIQTANVPVHISSDQMLRAAGDVDPLHGHMGPDDEHNLDRSIRAGGDGAAA